ncbi:ATP-binding protein [Candidatus Ruminimicrobium bovinum]|uniref:ATP-binding protein n=1 Tax=Candidatus Ruminimicrobium bovinum TaxID=3242779 RepID=UPI0039B8DB05
MAYLKRKIDSLLEEWKNNKDKNPLIVKGARQVGKTESIKNFAKKNYKNIIEINFVEEPKYKKIVEDGYGAKDIIKNISRLAQNKKFEEHKTLIFFDEIQEFPEIATSLKFFKQDDRFDVICSGSLLGINYNRIESVSVGYKQDFVMSSMDFEEFLWAKGYDDKFINEILDKMINLVPFNNLELNLYNSLFYDFCILGGMPAVVKNFIEKETFENTLNLQKQLIQDYKEDIRKYAVGIDQTRILNVFNHIPVQLAKENKKFQISKVSSGAKFKDYRGCIEWIIDAGIVIPCYCLNFPELPLKGNIDIDKYKLYFADMGLLIACLDEESQQDLRVNKNLGTYKGALYENIAANCLSKQSYDLYYYKRDDSRLEQDFFVRTTSNLVPVEVKASNGKSKSLSTLIKSKVYPDIQWGIKFINGNIGYSNNIYSFPYFCIFLLKKFLYLK